MTAHSGVPDREIRSALQPGIIPWNQNALSEMLLTALDDVFVAAMIDAWPSSNYQQD